MALTERQVFLVQASFRQVAPYSDKVATEFYDRLFQLDPSLKPLFKSDFDKQKRKLMYTVSMLVSSLHNLGTIVPLIQTLGKQHAKAYHVKKEHYHTVGEALLWALEQQLKSRFTLETKAAWVEVYTLIANTAIEAGYSE